MLPYLGALEFFLGLMQMLPASIRLFIYSCLGLFVLGVLFSAIIRHL